MELELRVLFVLLGSVGCFAQAPTIVRFVSEVTKGNAEHVDHLKESGRYGIHHSDCLAELDEREVNCPSQQVLGAVKIRVEESGRDVDIIIPELVLDTVYGSSYPVNRWRIAVVRRVDVCRSPIPHPPAVVTIYSSCYPLLKNQDNRTDTSLLKLERRHAYGGY